MSTKNSDASMSRDNQNDCELREYVREDEATILSNDTLPITSANASTSTNQPNESCNVPGICQDSSPGLNPDESKTLTCVESQSGTNLQSIGVPDWTVENQGTAITTDTSSTVSFEVSISSDEQSESKSDFVSEGGTAVLSMDTLPATNIVVSTSNNLPSESNIVPGISQDSSPGVNIEESETSTCAELLNGTNVPSVGVSDQVVENQGTVMSIDTLSTENPEVSVSSDEENESELDFEADKNGTTVLPIDTLPATNTDVSTSQNQRNESHVDLVMSQSFPNENFHCSEISTSICEQNESNLESGSANEDGTSIFSMDTMSTTNPGASTSINPEVESYIDPGISLDSSYAVHCSELSQDAAQLGWRENNQHTLRIMRRAEQLQENGEYEQALGLCEEGLNSITSIECVSDLHLMFCNNIMQLYLLMNRPEEAVNVYNNCVPFLSCRPVDYKIVQSMMDIHARCKSELERGEADVSHPDIDD